MRRAAWFLIGLIAGLAPVAASGRLDATGRVMLGLFAAGAVLGMAVTVMCIMDEK